MVFPCQEAKSLIKHQPQRATFSSSRPGTMDSQEVLGLNRKNHPRGLFCSLGRIFILPTRRRQPQRRNKLSPRTRRCVLSEQPRVNILPRVEFHGRLSKSRNDRKCVCRTWTNKIVAIPIPFGFFLVPLRARVRLSSCPR